MATKSSPSNSIRPLTIRARGRGLRRLGMGLAAIAEVLTEEVDVHDGLESTLTMLVKYEKDLERVKGALDKVLAELDRS